MGNTFGSTRWLEEKGICGKVVLVRGEFTVADELTASLIFELDDDAVGNQVLCGWW